MSIEYKRSINPTGVVYNVHEVKEVVYNGITVWSGVNPVDGTYMIYNQRPNVPGTSPVYSYVSYTDYNGDVKKVTCAPVIAHLEDSSSITTVGHTKENMHFEFVDGVYVKSPNNATTISMLGKAVITNDLKNRGTFATTKAVTKVVYNHLGSYKNSIVGIYQFYKFDIDKLTSTFDTLVDGSVDDACGEAFTYNQNYMDFTIEGPDHTPTATTSITCPYFVLRADNMSANGITELYINGVLVKRGVKDSTGKNGGVGLITLDYFKEEGNIVKYDWKEIDIYVEEDGNTTKVYIDTIDA